MDSLNLIFRTSSFQDEQHEAPAGFAVAQWLQRGVAESGWHAEAPENWRDSGWSIQCSRGARTLELALGAISKPHTGTTEWFLQVAPMKQPGFLARALGRRASASPEDCYALAQTLQSALVSDARCAGLKWRWNGPPDEMNSTREPLPPPGA